MSKLCLITTIVVAILFQFPTAVHALGQPVFASHIKGIEGPLKLAVETRLNAAMANQVQPLTPTTILKCYEDNTRIILKTLQAYGYYRASISKELVHLNDYWEAIYTIQAGPPLRITHLKFQIIGEGEYERYFQELLTKLPLHQHEVMSIENYNKTKQLLFTTAEQQGYLKAQLIQHTICIDLTSYTADITIIFDTGPRYYFGPVNFNSTPLNEKFLQRFISFKQGEPYSSTKLLKFQESLTNSNYFTDVSVEPDLNPDAYEVPLKTKVSMRKKYQYTFGLGYGTDTGVRAILGWDWRYVTTTGQQLSTLLQLSQVQRLINATYSIPGSNPLTEQYNINSSGFDNILPHGRSQTYQMGVNYVKTLEKWQQIISLNYQLGRFTLNNQPYQATHILTPAITWTYTDTDNLIFASRAQKFNFRIQGASKNILSDNNLIQTEIYDKIIHTFQFGQRVLVRGDLGYSVVNDLTSLPLTLQFVAGGTQSVRGYPYQSLGPGRYLTVGSVELQQPLFYKIYATGFYDIGNAYNNGNASLMSGAGLGLMWASPIGALELTIGKALNKKGQPTLIQFSMGPDL